MSRARAFRLIGLVAVLVAIGPLVVSIVIAQRQGFNLEFERALAYARDVAHRSDRAVTQMQDALAIMLETFPDQPCSEQMIIEMRRIALAREYIIGVGHMVDDRIDCSTFGAQEPPYSLGPAEVVTASGNLLRTNVTFPQVEGSAILALQRENFVALTHRTQALDMTVDRPDVLFATFSPGLPGLRTTTPGVNPQWADRLGEQTETVFIDDGYIVAVVRSEQVSLTGTIAAVPLSALRERITEFILMLAPVALLFGVGMAAVLLYLARYQMSLPNQIRVGLKRHEFFLVYQPVVDLNTGRWVGAEALLRWKQRGGGTVYPDSFIPAAEDSGLINELTERVVALAKLDMADFLREVEDFSLSINLSASDLVSERLPDLLGNLRKSCGGTEGRIVVELTERMLLSPEAAARNIANLRDQGIRVSIDDFGTGYSSLSYLEVMKFDTLKIDRLFVEAIDTEAATNRVVLHIIQMAQTLGLDIVAEGVESQAQADFLREHGVQFAQGWLYSQGLSASDFQLAFSAVQNGEKQVVSG